MFKLFKKLFEDIKIKNIIMSIVGAAILAFGLYNIHSFSGVTEGGILGAILLIDYWFHISPAITSFILNALCYLFGIRTLGRKFLVYTVVSTGSFSLFYALFESFPPIFPEIANYPLVATIVGAIFVGVSVGICVRAGGAPTGDDALAMSLSKITHIKLHWFYLASDLIVLLLSLTYIPFERIFYSLITVILSGQIIGLIVNYKPKKEEVVNKELKRA